ncbi:neuroligin-4, X-linked-like isoform X3 [Argiope bruennichi]|nr:neuroligin-4, X-linked-like isoform X3 [Argiope bruennichi]XP_055936158.1 neuroligin-4, X-linked-like isoform X3 [Argiope bruennichi]
MYTSEIVFTILTAFVIFLSTVPHHKCEQRRLSSRVVTTKYGAVRGFINSLANRQLQHVEVFQGIPYASAPIGSLRFMPPVTPPHWRGVKNADHLGPVCPQKLPDVSNETLALRKMPMGRLQYIKRLLPYLKNQSEDCLYLNIYAPAVVGREPTKLPVMVYIHGESYDWNSGNPYDGSVLASFGGVVVVTINYRLGVLGFLPAFDGTARGNYGLMDQVAALHWIQENIAEFGGDANNVTLFGQGHGAACVNFLMISPMARGLFQRAIMQSGSAFSPWALARDAATFTRYLASVLDCPTRDNTALVDCIRQRSISDIMRVQLDIPDYLTAFGPTIDGIVIPNEPAVLMKNYKDLFGQYDLLFGVTKIESYFRFSAHEEKFGIDSVRRDRIFRTLVRNVFTFHLQEIYLTILNEYTDWLHPEQHPLNIFETTVEALSDVLTVAPMLKAGNYHSMSHASKTFFYVFDHQTEESDYSPRMGCVSGEELNYIFGAPLVSSLSHFSTNYTRSEYSLARAVMTYWSNFAKTGDPNAIFVDEDEEAEDRDSTRYSPVSWSQYDRLHQRYLLIGLKSKMRDHYHSHRLSFWLHLIPSLNRPGEGNLSYEHHMLDDHNNLRTYDGKVRDTPGDISRVVTEEVFYPPQFPMPTNAPVPHSTTQMPEVSTRQSQIVVKLKHPSAELTEADNGADNGTYVIADSEPTSATVERTTPASSSAFDMGIYSTALSVTIAVGCSLLILNVLIFAGVYYQRDRNRMELALQKANFQQQQQQMSNRMDAGSASDPTNMSQGGTTKQHPMRAPPPSPAGQYLQVQDFTYPSINPAHYLNSLPPKHHQGIAVMGPPSVTNTPKTDPQNAPEAQPLLPQNQSEVRMMSHLWSPPNQEISV